MRFYALYLRFKSLIDKALPESVPVLEGLCCDKGLLECFICEVDSFAFIESDKRLIS